jgi:hypothetical protein
VLLAGSFLGGIFGTGGAGSNDARAAAVAMIMSGTGGSTNIQKPTNQVVKKKVNGMRYKRLGGSSSDIVVSEMGLGTQRWVSTDFNAPDEQACFEFPGLRHFETRSESHRHGRTISQHTQ